MSKWYLLRGAQHPGMANSRRTIRIGFTSSSVILFGRSSSRFNCKCCSAVYTANSRLSVRVASRELGYENSCCFCTTSSLFYFYVEYDKVASRNFY